MDMSISNLQDDIQTAETLGEVKDIIVNILEVLIEMDTDISIVRSSVSGLHITLQASYKETL